MGWLYKLLPLVVKLAGRIAKYMADKQLMDAGAYKNIAKNNEKTLQNIKAAHDARYGVAIDGDSLRDDKNNRDS